MRISFLCVAAAVFTLVGSAVAGDEWQYWNEFIWEHDINERISSELAFEQNIVDHNRDVIMYNTTVNISYWFSKMFGCGLEYKYEKEQDGREWPREHRLGIVPVVKFSMGDYKVKLTTKIEHRDLASEKKWRIKELAKVKRDINIGTFEITPFVSEEVFYDLSEDGGYNQNRVMVGLTKEFGSMFELSVYYMSKADKEEDEWRCLNVAGTELVGKF